MSPTTTTPTFAIADVPIEHLHPDAANPRRIDDAELDALERSIRTYGLVEPIIARREDGTVIGGHQRLVAARRLGYTSVPVIWLDLSVEQARLLGLALNKISGSWDEALLARLLGELQATPDVDVSLSGFGEDEIRDLLRSLDAREKRERSVSPLISRARSTQPHVKPRTRVGGYVAPWVTTSSPAGTPHGPTTLGTFAGQSQRPAMAFLVRHTTWALGDHGGQQRGTRRRRIANDALDPAAWENLRASLGA